MKIFVKAKPNSHQTSVERIDESHFVVSVKEPPVNGLANKGIVKILSDYFGVGQASVRIISGFTSKNKLVEIEKI
jgi:hypothetical protein